MLRSLLTLKALTYRPTGGIVAAPTTSLPEALGGVAQLGLSLLLAARRDLHALALMNGGYYEEAQAWRDWLLRAVAGSPARLQIMYGIGRRAPAGGARAAVAAGLRGIAPGADRQRRLRATAARRLWRGDGRASIARDPAELGADDRLELQRELVEHLETIWRQPDEGIWEVRGGRRHFTYSKVMAWVAFDRAVTRRRAIRPRGAGRALARAARRDP